MYFWQHWNGFYCTYSLDCFLKSLLTILLNGATVDIFAVIKFQFKIHPMKKSSK
jgi:hypothetical protein